MIQIALLAVAVGFVLLGVKGLSGSGLALSRGTTLKGTPAKVVGVVCLLAGLGLIPMTLVVLSVVTGRSEPQSAGTGQLPEDLPIREIAPVPLVPEPPEPKPQRTEPARSNPPPGRFGDPAPPTAVVPLQPAPPKPEASFSPVAQNRALAVRASNTYRKETPDLAFDGNPVTHWGAGGFPLQWIEVDLLEVKPLAGIKLQVAQSKTRPPGETTHEVWISQQPIGANTPEGQPAYVFQGATNWGDLLQAQFPAGAKARYVQVRSIKGRAWIAWGEIEILYTD